MQPADPSLPSRAPQIARAASDPELRDTASAALSVLERVSREAEQHKEQAAASSVTHEVGAWRDSRSACLARQRRLSCVAGALLSPPPLLPLSPPPQLLCL